MDKQRFDAWTRGLAAAQNRRAVLKGLLGIGGLTAVGGIARRDVEAARRGSTTPATATPAPTPPPAPTEPMVPPTETPGCAGQLCSDGCCDGQCTTTGACCPVGSTVCGPECCPDGQATCCDNACCFGVCYGEELCCPSESICGQQCCAPYERCCAPVSGQPVCVAADGCCADEECAGGRCIDNRCVGDTPTAEPSTTPTATSSPSATPTALPPPSISLTISGQCLAQLELTNFPVGSVLPAVQLWGKATSGSTPELIDLFSDVPIPFTGTLTLTFGFDLGAGGYAEVRADVDTGSSVYTTDWATITCVRPTVTPSPTPLDDPEVTVAFGANCALQVTLTGFAPGTDVRISVVGHIDAPIPIEIPVMFVPEATIPESGTLILPPLAWDPEALGIQEVQARIVFGRDRFDSDWTPVDCASPAPTMTPSRTATPSITATPTVTPTPTATGTPGTPKAVVGPTSDCRAQVELTGFPPNSTVGAITIWGAADFGLLYRLAIFQDEIETDSTGHAIATSQLRVGKRMRQIRATVRSGDIDLDTGWTVWSCQIGRSG